MKNRIGLLLLIAAFGCQTPKIVPNVEAIPTPIAQRLDTELFPETAPTETRSEPQTPDIRFAIEKNLIGKTEAQVKGLIGSPKEESPGCRTNVQDTEVEINVLGNQWRYKASAGNYSAEMDLCLFRGKVIAQQLRTRIDGAGRIDVRTRSATDHRLINELLLDKTKTDKDLLMEEELEKGNYLKKDL